MLFTKWLVIFMAALVLPVHAASDTDWLRYKQRFIQADGRVVDTGNQNISHSEGQGFGMLFAVAFDDPQTFEQLWKWTQATLHDEATGLFYWKYNPNAATPIEDKNNASDGDVLIAWALLKAGQQWDQRHYLQASDKILRALLKHNIVDFAGKKVMLPGSHGFTFASSMTLNPSYFIYPAWQDFFARTRLYDLQTLIDDTQQLMLDIDWGKRKIATDWITLYADGTTSPATQWPARASYDAIRVPVYIAWRNPDHPILARWQALFSPYNRLTTPAWEMVSGNQKADYPMSGGLLAVRDFTMGELSPSSTHISRYEDYYSASLKMLVKLADTGF
ncbi:glycosyl hydrolase family 8 [Vibrio hippocampi]|uniref:Glucanase n=1 Tax=Vibrio hippocampi TaxID=654686 RepID=A0ABN8DHQ7_9VIBR|nr:glycosyl hydrolase family 8 [Vibrio hippocampi]CAH0526207.1 Minor endoglucanase Y [Vibrio hippocampi]